MTPRAGTALVEGLLLALWLGAAALFTLVVARAAFAVLPTRTLAGALVGRVLPVLFIAGILVGLAVLLLERPAWAHRPAVGVAAGVVALACAAAQFAVAPRIARLRAEIGGPLESLAMDDARRAAFGRLHAVSVGWLGVAMLAAVLAIVFIWRALDAARLTPTR